MLCCIGFMMSQINYRPFVCNWGSWDEKVAFQSFLQGGPKFINFMMLVVLMLPDLLKISGIIFSYHLADGFEFRACLADRCLCSQNIYKYLNKSFKGYKRIIQEALRRSGYFSIFLRSFLEIHKTFSTALCLKIQKRQALFLYGNIYDKHFAFW